MQTKQVTQRKRERDIVITGLQFGICMDKDSVLMILVQRSLRLCIVPVDSRSV